MQKVIFLFGDSLGGIYEYVGRALTKAFEAIHCELLPLRMARTPQFFTALDAALEQEPAFVIGYAGAGHALTVDPDDPESANLWEFMQLPHLSFYGDSPAYAFDFHRQHGSYSVSLYGYTEHLELRRQLPSIRGLLCRALPYGLAPNRLEDIDLDAKRRGKILFLKNGNDPLQLETFWRKSLNSGTAKHLLALREIVEAELRQGISRPVEGTVFQYLMSFGITPVESQPMTLLFFAQIDDYLRRIKSTLIADTLLEFPVEVWGTNWGHVQTSGRRGTLVNHSDMLTSNRAMKEQALCIVDMSPNTDSSYHDRQIRAADAMTLCLTNEQEFLKKDSAYSSSFTFRFTKESIGDCIERALADPQGTIELGVKVSDEFRVNWDTSRELRRWCDIADLVRTNGMTEPLMNSPKFLVWPPVLG